MWRSITWKKFNEVSKCKVFYERLGDVKFQIGMKRLAAT